MMQTEQAYDFIASARVIAGLRGHFPPDVALRVAEIMMAQGITAFEFTLNSEQPIPAMQAVKREYGESACVGMGTVLSVDEALRVLDAGADFVVSPAFQPDVLRVVLDADVLMAPGVTTPSEAVAAWDMGAPMLKIFPIGVLGLDYFKAVRGPLNHMKFMCNGGMTGDNAAQFLKAGAVACGMAGWLTGDGHAPDDLLRTRAAHLQQAVRAVVDGGGQIV
ncbi:MAG: hypothetical protein EA396_00560 [Anaerolineaceae bacterium]|nr:MAG: hypothetical protein EA396_00560 [Anaerolineaceae bacterium]